MANPRSRAWGPTQPSAAFLIKCAKEREKLRTTLQTQLQEHMLDLLQNQLFTDLQIEINFEKTNGKSSSPHSQNHLELINCHKSILKIRAPTFYKHLLENENIKCGVSSYSSYLQEVEIKDFLKKVYTDDDVRKYECEALHLSRKYYELLCEKKGPLNKHIVDVDEFEKDSVTSDNFVTPKSTPISPENKINVCDMFKTAQIAENARLEKLSSAIEKSFEMKAADDEDLSPTKNLSNGYPSQQISNEFKDSLYIDETEDKPNKNDSSASSSEDESDQEFEPEEYSNVGSMVRSNTFDLETQGSLEETIDDSNEWCSRPTSDSDYRDDCFDKDSTSSRRLDGTGFFLHDHTPSPNSNIFKRGFSKESFNNGHQVDLPTSGVHVRRLDGSMSDSGFLSHSTFSVISDGAFPGSVSSSLIMSSDEMTSPSHISMKNGTEITISNLEDSKRLSGSMFPFYIDMNSLPSNSPDMRKDKKSSSPSHTYMYIDAGSGRKSVKKKHINTSYDEFFAEFESEKRYTKKDPLIKAQSTSQLDMYNSNYRTNETLEKLDEKSRPLSCYMYVDLDSVSNENLKTNMSSMNGKHEPSAVSMFVNLNDANDNSTTSDSLTSKEIKASTEDKILPAKINYVNGELQINSVGDSDQFQKNSDSSLLLSQVVCSDNNFKSYSLTRHGEVRSTSASEYHFINGQYGSPQHIKNGLSRQARSAHRYSDGIFYENLDHQPNFIHRNSNYGQMSSDSKSCQIKDLRVFNQQITKLHNLTKDEESSGSCSNLGEFKDEALLSDDKVKWKSTGDMGKPKNAGSNSQCGLLPMSPILRRKCQVKDQPKLLPPPIVKASTKPQDVDAMKFPKSFDIVSKIEQVESNSDSSPCHKKLEHSKSSSDSSRLVDVQSDSSEGKEKLVDSMSRSASSQLTVSGTDSSSEKHIPYDILKERIPHSGLSFSFSGDFDDDSETIYSEVSDVSSSLGNISGIASLERHWRENQHRQVEVNTKSLITTHQMLEACSKLGEDLLRMFLEEVDTDITLEVEGKEIKAHRCILSSRCKYFANLLSTSHPDKNSSRISLEGFTFSAVHFALCHIYSGAMSIPKDCNLSELALLADMLNLGTLTDVIVFHLKMHFCHFFHRPCLQCTQGVVECLPLAVLCGLTELRDKCIFWLGKYFTRTWPNKSFAALSDELRDLCYNVTALNITIDTVIEMTLNCDRLMTTLPQMKWTEPIFGMVTRLLQDCIHFMAQHFTEILSSESFHALGKGQSWNVTALEEDIISSVELTTPDVACKSYVTVSQLLVLAESPNSPEYTDFTQNFVDLLHKISRHCERYLIQNANKVVHCESWACLSTQVQKRIKDAAVIVFEFEKPTAPPPRLSSLHRKLKKQSNGEEFSCIERSTYPKKGKSMQKKDQKEMNLPKLANQESPERSLQRRETENLVKKVVSPIKEEVHNSSADTFDILSCALDPFFSSPKSHISNKAYIDAHEEDSLRDLQDLPQDQSLSQCASSTENHAMTVSTEVDGIHTSAHCSDNPDSLETNDISSDSKEDALILAEDIGIQEKGVIETPEVLNKNFECAELQKEASKFPPTIGSSLPKASFPRDKVPLLQPLVPHNNEKNLIKNRDRSPVKKMPGKSLVPLAKTYNMDEKLPISSGKDLVAEIDADSKMVNHCLQEAEMLEQQLSRKLQRQHQDGTCNISHYIQNSPVRNHLPPEHKNKAYKLQKASSTSQIKSLAGAAMRGKSPGRLAKSNASSPSVGHAPRIMRSSESREKIMPRKSSQSPKGSSTHRSFKSMESIASVHKQLSVSSSHQSKRVLSKSNRPKAIVNTTRSPIITNK